MVWTTASNLSARFLLTVDTYLFYHLVERSTLILFRLFGLQVIEPNLSDGLTQQANPGTGGLRHCGSQGPGSPSDLSIFPLSPHFFHSLSQFELTLFFKQVSPVTVKVPQAWLDSYGMWSRRKKEDFLAESTQWISWKSSERLCLTHVSTRWVAGPSLKGPLSWAVWLHISDPAVGFTLRECLTPST